MKRRLYSFALIFFAGISTAGCGSSNSIKTHEIAGQIVFNGGDVKELAGHHIEAVAEADPKLRATGVIEPDGKFRLETLNDGKLQSGAPAGKYVARLVINDEGEGTERPKVRFNRRYLDFKTSGWTLEVPNKQAVALSITLN